VIWDALKGTCEAPDPETARLIIESAGVIVGKADGTVFYDERGAQKAALLRQGQLITRASIWLLWSELSVHLHMGNDLQG